MVPKFTRKVQTTFIVLVVVLLGGSLFLSRRCDCVTYREGSECPPLDEVANKSFDRMNQDFVQGSKQNLLIRNLSKPTNQHLPEVPDENKEMVHTNANPTKLSNQTIVKSATNWPVELRTQNKTLQNKQRCQKILSQSPQNVTKYSIQLLSAAPGSGSDWCLYIIGLLTGLKVTGVYPENTKVKDYKLLPKVHYYYKTHYPFMANKGWLETYLDTHSERAILMIRNPFDAGFSDFIRDKIERMKLRRKYANLTKIFSNSSFTLGTNQGTLGIQKNLLRFLNAYFSKWKYHHKYWLTEYKGPLKVALYKDLVEDLRLFKDALRFFGYEPDSSEERKMRFDCALQNALDNKPTKRPSVKFIETSKETVRQLYRKQTDSAISFVERLYFTKYNTTLHIV